MSRIDLGAKPLIFPMPVLIIGTYDKDGVPNAMNAAWGMISDMNEISISLSEHKTTENLAVTGAFTVSMATEGTVVPCDYVGIESAKKVPDKFAKAGFHATKSSMVNAPLIDELPVALECKVKSFENGILIGGYFLLLIPNPFLVFGYGRTFPIAYAQSIFTFWVWADISY